ncbi:MAG: hypothetical protein AMJ88_13460 [Anaerolineae bacterium SM23_ 63]|nr:MAG: hypothetical protein AMJ88_13460 [Anaerolineae bacterium SM23_ 63]
MPKEFKQGAHSAGADRSTLPTSGHSGRQIRRWVNEKTGIGTETVLSDAPSGVYPGIYYNMSEGEILHITGIHYGLFTISDSLIVELGMCSAVAGGGTFIPLTPKFHIATGTAIAGHLDQEIDLAARSIAIPYSAASLSITMRVNANDADASATVGWTGYIQ